MIKTKEPSPEMAEASRPSGFRAKRRSWREDKVVPSTVSEDSMTTKAYLIDQLINKNVTTNGEQTGNNQLTNGEQTGNNQLTNGEQTGNNQLTNGEQKKESVNKRLSKPITSQLTNGIQKDNKRVTKVSFFELVGLQRKVTLYVYDSCKLTRSPISGPITLEAISICLQSPKGSVKMTTNRLREKGVIETIDQKEGRGGFTKYRITDSVYQEILHCETDNKRITNGIQTDNKWLSKPITQPITSIPSSSSIYVLEDLKKTTTTGPENKTETVGSHPFQLEPDWLKIDYSVLSEIHFGQPQLSQLAQLKKLTPIEIQDSIDAFAFDLRNNRKAEGLKTQPLNFFMGILRKGMPYTPPENYESPETEARRKYLEAKQAQKVRRHHIEMEIFELEFEEWRMSLTPDQRLEYAPEARVDESQIQLGYLKNYFRHMVYQKSPAAQTVFGSNSNQEVLTAEQVRAIADAQFGAQKE